jgi:hypothetical protein
MSLVFVGNLVIGTEMYNRFLRGPAIVVALFFAVTAVYSLIHVCVRCSLSDIEDKEIVRSLTPGGIMRLVQVMYVVLTAFYWTIGYLSSEQHAGG